MDVDLPRLNAIVGIVIALSLTGPVTIMPAARAAAAPTTTAPTAEPSVPGRPVASPPPSPGAEDAVRTDKFTRMPTWPVPRVSIVDPTAASARPNGPVSVETGAKLRLEILAPSRVAQLGGVGIGVRVNRAEEGAGTKARLTLDPSGFVNAFNGAFADRLGVVRLPGCVAEAHQGECPLLPQRLPARRDPAGRMIVEVDAVPEDEPAPVVMLASSSSGSNSGNFGATDLAPTGTWQAGLQSGSFNYSYPVPQPPSLTGDGPDLTFAYSSSAVDGLTSSTNGQAGWTGLGWSLSPGFIERRYRSCADDAQGSGKKASQRDWGHLCWESPDENDGQTTTTDPTNSDMVLSLEGRSSAIVKDRLSGQWKTAEDFGWKLEYLSNGASGQPYWQVTTQEGDVHRFGYRRDSMWQVPYAGDDPGEPCNNIYNTGGSSYPGMCQGTWRWNLDQVVDTNDNLTTLYWKREAWKYRYYASEECCTIPPTFSYTSINYDRGGYLDRIEWGSNLRVSGSVPTSKTQFNLVSRCSSTTTRDDPLANPYPIDTGTGNLSCTFGSWDVPDDLMRCETYDCPIGSPSYFIVRRLDSIVTYSWEPVSATWQDVHKLQLRFKYIFSPENGGNGCCVPALWLDYIRPVGVAGSGEIRMPVIEFDAVELNGRVNWGQDFFMTRPKSILPRIGTVHNGFGGRVEVSYGRANACPDGGTGSSGYGDWYNGTAWDNPTQDCFRTFDFWFPTNEIMVFWGVYHKYLVTKVVEKDVVGGSPDVVTTYEYEGRPAWAKPVNYMGTKVTAGTTTQVETASWSEARGYGRVRVLEGGGTDPAGYSATTHAFHRGMYDDVYSNGAAKGFTVTDFDGNVLPDRMQLAGSPLEDRTWRMTTYSTNPAQRQYTEVESTRYEYALATSGDGPGILDPTRANRVRSRSREVLSAGGNRYTDHRIAYNADGMPIRANDYGQDGVGDNTCTSTTYTMVSYPAITEEHAGDDCATGALIGRSENLYDADGNLTEARTWSSATAMAKVLHTFDGYGRETSTTDALGRVTSTVYSPAVNWPYNGVTVTNPLGHRSTTTTSPLHGKVVRHSDVDNGRLTESDYDALGRVTAIFGPGEPRSAGTPTATMAYTVTYNGVIGQPSAAAKTTSARLRSGSGDSAKWTTQHAFDDGWGRPRESQEASPSGGRIVSSTTYDGRGLTLTHGEPVHNTSAAGSGLLNAAPTSLPSWTKLGHDGLERRTEAVQQNYAATLRRSTVDYRGADEVFLKPQVAWGTQHWNDAQGKLIRTVEWKDWGVGFETRYEYDLNGHLTRITDARGNVRSYTYDWLGRRLNSSDPDSGPSASTYDTAGRLMSTVDGRGQKVSREYDALDRLVRVWSGEVGTGTKLAEWTYDTLVKGQLTSSVSYSGGNAYVDEVLAYDQDYRPTSSRITIPAAEGALAGTYTFTTAYNRMGGVVEVGMPAAGGLNAEKVTASYTDLGYLDRLTSDYVGGSIYVNGTVYSKTGKAIERRYGSVGQVKRTLAYDDATGRLTNVTTLSKANTATPVVAQNDEFHYDGDDNIARIVDKAQAAPQTECFQNDTRNRLSFAWTTTKPDCSEGWWHSPDWRGDDPYWRYFEYDSAGNITKQDTAGYVGDYVYPAAGSLRPNAVAAVRWPDHEDTYSYDNSGNLISRTVSGQTTTFAWDPLGRLASSNTNGQSSGNVYDTEGERLIRREPGRTTLYLGQMELELAGGAVTARRYYSAGSGAVVAVRAPGTLTWLLADPQRSEQLAIDNASATVQRQRYLPFGGHRGGRDDITSTQRGFLGKTEDAGSGLVELGARFYDPTLGRFVSPDPIVDLRTPEWSNAYAYAGNNPVTRMDPTGLAGCDPTEDCDLKRKFRKVSKRVAKNEKKLKKQKQINDNKSVCWNLGKRWACNALPKKDRTPPKPTCDAKCRKESNCTGANKGFCGPAGPPTKAEDKKKDLPMGETPCSLTDDTFTCGTRMNLNAPLDEYEYKNPMFAGGCPQLPGLVIQCAATGGGGSTGGPGTKRIVIGEGMDDIKEVARKLTAKWYQAWSKNFDPKNFDLDKSIARNERWLRQKMKEGYEIYDIGIDPSRLTRSPFYGTEKDLLRKHGYPTIPHPRP